MTTLAHMKLLEDGEELRDARYRRLRATCVLAEASKHVADMQDGKLNKALAAMRKNNFDMEQVSNNLIEYIYATFDEDVTETIIGEFTFVPKWTNVKDLGDCSGHCDLCGKGDSLDHRENRDKIRYMYRLQNTAGGNDVWVGSTCILQHGLHVDGARTAEEAEKLIKKAFNQAKKQWEIERWRDENPDHFEIPEQWEQFRKVRFYTYPPEFYSAFKLSRQEMLHAWYRLMGKARDGSRNHFRAAARQYERRNALTPGKHEAWIEAQRMLSILNMVFPRFRKAMELDGDGHGGGYRARWYKPTEKALDFLDEEAKKLRRTKAWKEVTAAPDSVKKRKRSPRRVKSTKRSPRRVRS